MRPNVAARYILTKDNPQWSYPRTASSVVQTNKRGTPTRSVQLGPTLSGGAEEAAAAGGTNVESAARIREYIDGSIVLRLLAAHRRKSAVRGVRRHNANNYLL